MIAANDYVDPMLPRMSPVQLRMLIAQATGLLAFKTGGYETRTILTRVIQTLPYEPPRTGRIIRDVAARVAAEAGLSVEELCSASRRADLVRARWRAFYEIYEMGGSSMPQIGRYFGGRDHTTVLHGIREYGKILAAVTA